MAEPTVQDQRPADQAADDHRFARDRMINAPASTIFALLSDPSRHHETTPKDWVRDAITTEPITGVGQVFAMNMFFARPGVPEADGRYVMHNRVAVFEQDKAIAWDPGQPDEQGNPRIGGWRWRYDLEPVGDSTLVTLTYDWSACPPQLRDHLGLPPFGPEFLDQSLQALDRALTGD